MSDISKITYFLVEIEGPEDTPYHYGVFKVDVEVPQRYRSSL